MTIKELSEKQGVVFNGKKEKDQKICTNCNRLKINHNSDQTDNCVRAIYLRA